MTTTFLPCLLLRQECPRNNLETEEFVGTSESFITPVGLEYAKFVTGNL